MSATSDDTLEVVIDIVTSSASGRTAKILPTTSILTELNLDSLQTLELVERLKDRFGIDFLVAPYSVRDLVTPAVITARILAHRDARSTGFDASKASD